ncbi:MAG: chorismate mutase [Methylocystis sp.]
MTSTRLEAEDKRELSPQEEMADVRKVIDALDDEIVALLAKRQRQIERAARVKPLLELPARVPDRVDEVIARVLGAARREGLSMQVALTLWTHVIEWSIRYEEKLMGACAPTPRDGDDGTGDGG